MTITTRVRVLADFGCFPTWTYDGHGGLVDNVRPDAVGASPTLSQGLIEWSARLEAIFVRDDPGSSAWPSAADEADFVAAGRELAQMLADELGEPVTYSGGEDIRIEPRGVR